MEGRPPRPYDDYTVGWICALPLEAAAAKLMLDEIHSPLPRLPKDQNTYILGSIGEHKIVIASLPSGAYGATSAATVGLQLLSSFPAIRFGFMIGIGGGVPSSNADIRLGDIVVSRPRDTFGGVVQYDLGKTSSDGQFKRTGMLNRPPKVLLTALATLEAHHYTEDSAVVEFISNIQGKIAPHKASKFARPAQQDCLFHAAYDHVGSETCTNCDRAELVTRPQREHEEPVIHYGLIGSANQVVKDARLRDRLAQELDIYCVEMEAAGLMNDFPCLVIRGICDYADSHKNKEWQGYAAIAAAAYAKELLLVVPVEQVNNTPTARGSLADSGHRFDIPFNLTGVPVIENFLGRQGELERLREYLRPTDTPSRKVAVIHGLGGMGKTQLAIRFARHHKHDFSAIFWLSGKDRGMLLQALSSSFGQLPEQSHISAAINGEEVEQRAKSVLRWLALDGNSRWLIIFDNVDQYPPFDGSVGDAYDIAEFFPSADHGSILITSRLQRLTELGKPFPIQRLDPKNSIQLLLQSSRHTGSPITGLESDPDTLTLASRLDGLPLAIVIAGAFMRETGTSIAEYLQYYKGSWSDLQLHSYPERQYQRGNMLQTWMISYHGIQKRDPIAASLLLYLSRFDNRDIWYELVKHGCHSSDVPTWLERTISSPLAFRAVAKTLVGFSFLEIKEQGGAYAMHPVVQDWCIHLASSEPNVDSIQLQELALVSVGYNVPSTSDKSYSEIQRRLIPHANYVRHGSWRGKDTAALEAVHLLGSLYSDQGMLKEAEKMYQRALVGREEVLGPDHPSTLDTVNNLGNIYKDQGKLNEADKMYQRALAGREKALGPEHPSTLNTVHNLGNRYSDQGKLKEAEEIYQRVLTGRKKALGYNHPSTLGTVNNLGNLYRDQGNFEMAEKMYQQALAGCETVLGPDHPSTLGTVNNWGNLYRGQGKLMEAEEMYQRALAGYTKALGADHPSTLDIVSNLGSLYGDQGKFKDAEVMYQRVLAGREKALDTDHPSILTTVHNLGNLYSDQGKLKKAEKMYQRVLAGCEKALGPDHPSTFSTINNLGNLYRDQGHFKKAEKMYEQALAGCEKVLGPDHPSTFNTVINLGSLYREQGELRRAQDVYQRSLSDCEKALGSGHCRTRKLAERLTALYTADTK